MTFPGKPDWCSRTVTSTKSFPLLHPWHAHSLICGFSNWDPIDCHIENGHTLGLFDSLTLYMHKSTWSSLTMATSYLRWPYFRRIFSRAT